MGSEEKRKFITAKEAISLLPEGDEIHIFHNEPWGLIDGDRRREDIVEALKKADRIELTGPKARSMKHGLAVYNNDIKWQSEVLFVETDETKLNEFDPL